MLLWPSLEAVGALTVSGKADLNIRGVVWAIDTGALHLQVDYSVGLVSVKAQGAVPLGDRSYHVWSGLIERASSFLSWFRHDMSQTSDPLLVLL